jgi:hypothetical protein
LIQPPKSTIQGNVTVKVSFIEGKKKSRSVKGVAPALHTSSTTGMFRLVALLAAFFIPPTNSLDNRDVGSETAYGIPIICPENNVPVGQWDQFLIVDKPYKNMVKP